MQGSIEQLLPDDPDWQQLCNILKAKVTLVEQVLVAWQMGIWLARTILEHQLQEQAAISVEWQACPVCQARLVSKGFANRRILTLVGWVEWKRRVGRCPRRCRGSQSTPFDQVLGINAYQQTSVELMRLGCLLAVCLPFELTAWMLQQLSGIQVSDDTIWNWVQSAGQQANENLELQLQQLGEGQPIQTETLDAPLLTMPLMIAADGVTVPFRPQAKTPKGKIVWREVKVALLARLGNYQTRTEATRTQLHQRRVVASLGDINHLKPRLQLEALKQGMITASQVVWISDGARGFWRLYRECFAPIGAVGILDFYHAAQHLWQAASVYQDGNPHRTPQQWFASLRHRLRHGFGKGIIKELDWLSKSKNTAEATKPILRQVRDYLKLHLDHIQYRSFKQMGLPIGSGMVESACKWMIQQRFKGAGMRWSEDGFNHLLHLRLAWTNQRFDSLFSNENLSLSLYSPN
ncbi:ISKra4 family transposase [Leptolyngbya sp. NIES-2104]|uniref:ISKra4 family transposase n=1 Tax=Leptolyngbya sp. NIES-2104 TaxID=1552121 RepID=UPI0006ECAB89|nr:hypothetical protein NIES2104_63560 [Leptolyngbya sp. NIES-2104]